MTWIKGIFHLCPLFLSAGRKFRNDWITPVFKEPVDDSSIPDPSQVDMEKVPFQGTYIGFVCNDDEGHIH